MNTHSEPENYLKHIKDECDYLTSVVDNCSGKEEFLNDETIKRASIRSLEIIGEASKKIPKEFREKYNDIQWKNMAGMRDRLIHDYMGVNYNIVWDVMTNKIPDLQYQMIKILSQ